MDKTALLEAIIRQLQSELTLQTEAALASRDEATNEESRAEDKYDMRSQSAAYLAAGQAKFATEIAAAIAAYRNLRPRPFAPGEAAGVGAVVTLEARGRPACYFIGPLHGGLEVVFDGTPVIVITAGSPMGRQLVGRRAGETVELPGQTAPVAHRLLAVA